MYKWCTYLFEGIKNNNGGTTSDIEAMSLTHRMNEIEIYSNSWGESDETDFGGPDTIIKRAILRGISNVCIYILCSVLKFEKVDEFLFAHLQLIQIYIHVSSIRNVNIYISIVAYRACFLSYCACTRRFNPSLQSFTIKGSKTLYYGKVETILNFVSFLLNFFPKHFWPTKYRFQSRRIFWHFFF